MNGIDRQPGISAEDMDQRPSAGFDGQGHGPALEALGQLLQPGVEHLGGVDQGARLGLALNWLQRHGVALVSPIQANAGHEGGSGFRFKYSDFCTHWLLCFAL